MSFTQRSAATRQAILSAARRLLSEHGYEAMTIRAVAAEVGIDPSMVMRYYGNKAGLFTAAVDVDLYLQTVQAVPKSRLGKELTRHFIARWEGELADEVTALLLRSATTNEQAAERMRSIFDTQVTAFVQERIGGSEASLRAGLLSGQLLGLAFTRYVLKLQPVTAMSMPSLVETVGPVVQYYLTAKLGSRPASNRQLGEASR